MIRSRNDLDDFLYELDSPYSRPQAARAFDYIDMVFMEGEPSLLPWAPAASKVKSIIISHKCIRC